MFIDGYAGPAWVVYGLGMVGPAYLVLGTLKWMGDDAMSWQWPWQRPRRMTDPGLVERGARSRQVWADLVRPEGALARAAEVATRNARDLAALERVLNEPTLTVDRPLMRRGQRWRCRGGGQR